MKTIEIKSLNDIKKVLEVKIFDPSEIISKNYNGVIRNLVKVTYPATYLDYKTKTKHTDLSTTLVELSQFSSKEIISLFEKLLEVSSQDTEFEFGLMSLQKAKEHFIKNNSTIHQIVKINNRKFAIGKPSDVGYFILCGTQISYIIYNLNLIVELCK